MSFNGVFLGGLLSSRARLRFPRHPSLCNRNRQFVQNFAANGKPSNYTLSHKRAHPMHPRATRINRAWEARANYSIKSTYVHQISTGFHKRSDLHWEQMPCFRRRKAASFVSFGGLEKVDFGSLVFQDLQDSGIRIAVGSRRASVDMAYHL